MASLGLDFSPYEKSKLAKNLVLIINTNAMGEDFSQPCISIFMQF